MRGNRNDLPPLSLSLVSLEQLLEGEEKDTSAQEVRPGPCLSEEM